MSNTENQIKVNELRLGNLITAEINGEQIVVSVSSIDEEKIGIDETKLSSSSYMRNHNHNYAIAITSKWLERLGFVDSGDYKDYYYLPNNKTKITVTKINDEYELRIAGLLMLTHYIHQLQNIIHALTGEELEVDNALLSA